MKRKITRIITLMMLLVMMFTSLSCKSNNTSTSNEETLYTITFESNGGSSINNVNAKAGDEITKPTDPIKDGYTFIDWYENIDSEKAFVFSYMPARSFTLYAKWEKQTLINKVYKVVDASFTWGNNEEKKEFLDETEATEEQFIELYKSIGLTIDFKDEEKVLVYFIEGEKSETKNLYYVLDKNNVLLFYESLEDKEANNLFKGLGLFTFTFTVSKDYKEIVLSTNVSKNSTLQIICR
mgnify:CR=1 FL=1